MTTSTVPSRVHGTRTRVARAAAPRAAAPRAAAPRAAALWLGATLALAGATLAPASGSAQTPAAPDGSSVEGERPRTADFHGSAYLPLGHWAYGLIDRWIADGRAPRLSPLYRPHRRMDVARALQRLALEPLAAWEARWWSLLAEELQPELDALRGRPDAVREVRLSAVGGAAWHSQTHRDPLRPALAGPFAPDRLLERLFLRAHWQAGPVAGGFRGGRDGIFLHDAQFPDGRVVPDQNFPILREFGYRTEEGYLELQSRYARLGFGRLYRDWGMSGLQGFLRSSYAYSEEEVSYRVGTERIFLSGLFSAPQDFGPDTARYVSMHRLEIRPSDALVLAATEAVVWGGPDARLDLALLNPLSFWHAVRDEERSQRNAMGQVDVWWRAAPGVVLLGALVVDGTNSPRTSDACCAMGGAVGVDLTRLARGWTFRARGTAVQSLVYRTGLPWEEWSLDRVGLGWDKSDLYLATLEGDWFASPGLLLRPRLDLQLLGEGDFRRPHPTELADYPRILVGTAETTLRASVAGRWRAPGSPAELEWDLGLSQIWDAAHLSGARRFRPVGWIRAVVEAPDLRLPLAP